MVTRGRLANAALLALMVLCARDGLAADIRVRVDDTTLVFENDLRPGPIPARSTGIGLANLRERFRIATGRPAEWIREDDRFVVRLPLVKDRT